MTAARSNNARVAAAAASALLAVAGCSQKHAPPAPAPAPVTTIAVAKRDMPVLSSAVGSVEAINSVAVKSLIDGQLLESRVKDGAR